MNILYRTKVTATGGRGGSLLSEDGLLRLPLSLPRAMGGKEDATNPEQLFAGGYAACFGNAVLHVARLRKMALADSDVVVTGDVGVGLQDGGAFALTVALHVTICGTDQATADDLVQAAHAVCPYSNAVRGNIAVALDVTVK